MQDYNTDVYPLLQEYNHTNDGHYPLIPIDDLSYIRGSGQYNPAPTFPQTIDRGNAWSNAATVSNNLYGKYSDFFSSNGNNVSNEGFQSNLSELYKAPSGIVETENSWDINTNYNLKPSSGDNYQYYDEYQRWAYNTTRISDPYILPYLFSKINVHFIQDSVKEHIKKYRNINIETKQDTNGLLNLMLTNYYLYYKAKGVFMKDDNTTNSYSDPSCSFESILGNLNKSIIEKYIKNVLSGLNMHEYYMKDISTLPVPLSNPVLVSNKGSNVLGYVGPFEDNHAFTKNIDSFNFRDVMPDKMNNVNYGN